ncbi:23619_t:CDS:2 [Entrophospora sp. SA101]|nr:4223_t:CDS:2 [Entrophospora sp. SA101]CAJ0748181.1 23619_t:CDS:2 [Entrophospora sp. SA101]CAJ0825413.1 624_t:CDS:2 [Entrophospora sp. SA101]CAJ0908940.1 19732_t:CDS:2 [Entrophospora sp. SA101]
MNVQASDGFSKINDDDKEEKEINGSDGSDEINNNGSDINDR